MPRLKAASVANQPTRKRKHSPAPAPTAALHADTKPTAQPWPAHFERLSHLHRALNLVYTFCCTRKHFATTFDNLKAAVQAHIHRELRIDHVAQVKALIPHAIRFAYVDEHMLQLNLMGAEQSRKRADEFALAAADQVTVPEQREVLLFEFVDGDLKRQPSCKNGQQSKTSQRLRNQDLKMPAFSHKHMTNLIEKRNSKFATAVQAYLDQCARDRADPVEKLETQGLGFLPVEPTRPPTPTNQLQAPLPATIPTERKSIPNLISEIKTLDWYTGQIVPDGHRVFDPQSPVYGELSFPLSQSMVNALFNSRNITALYAHQAEAINNLHHGHHVIVSTSTSSGKSLIYQIPVLHQLEQDPTTRALYIFPTKALAQDQHRSLKELLRFMQGLQDTSVDTFDGDTPMTDRSRIRDDARIIFTNPDMLHITILPHEDTWRSFLQNLRLVVVDELHVYNGLFGSHMAFIMRRLRRICAAVGNRRLQFVSCSATIANPQQHMKTIFGVDDVTLTDFDGSPSGRKEFLCWNTPFRDPADPTSGRGDGMHEAARLFCQLILRGVRVIAFCVVRKQCESLLAAIKTELARLDRDQVTARVMAYRGGYTAQDRRRIERDMFEGRLMGIVATSALELGVDIGSLDAVISVGFPYTISNLRQQSGRAGRRNKDSLSVLLGNSFPTDQHYMANPDELFTKPNCELQVDLENLLVLEGHVQCAAYEMPIFPAADTPYFGSPLPQLARERLRKDDDDFYHTHNRFLPHPSRKVGIRDTEDDHFAIVDVTHQRNAVLEEIEASRAFFTIYEGAIFLHQGSTYLVRDMSTERMLAQVERVAVDWTTEQRDFTDIDPIETEAVRAIPHSASRAFYGAVRITHTVFGFFKVDRRRRILDAVPVSNPPIVRHTKGMWLDVPQAALQVLSSRKLHLAGAIHAAEHAVLSLVPSYVVSMPAEVRTECKVPKKEFAQRETSRKRPARLTFYDAKGGASGSGISGRAFDFAHVLLERALQRLDQCACLAGCLECCCSEFCKEENIVTSKAGARVIVMWLLGKGDQVNVDALPWGEEEGLQAGIETVIPAEEIRSVRH